MKKLIIAFIIYQSAFIIASAQQSNLDSLWHVWENEQLADTVRLEAISRLAMPGFVFSNPDSAFKLAALQYAYAEKIKNKSFMASALNIQGVSFAMQGNYPRSIEYFLRVKSIHEETGNKQGLAGVMNNLGRVYDGNHEYNKSKEIYIECLAILEEIGDEKGMVMPLINLGFNYANRGNVEAGLESLNRAYDIALKFDNKRGVFDAMAGISYCYELNNDLETALEFSLKSLALSKQIGPELSIVQMLNSVGKLYQQLGEPKIAITYCEEGFERAEKATSLFSQKNACDCLYNAHKALGQSKIALQYHEQLLLFKDSIFNEENTEEVTRLEMQYEFDKQQAAEQAEQEKKDALSAAALHREQIIRNGFIVGFVVVLLFAIVFFGQRNKIGKEKERSDQLLLNILPEEVATELKVKGKSEARDFDDITVLFTDFKSFTEQSEKLSASELVNEINHCFEAFDGIIEKYSIEKIKTIGDAYMAAGGLPVPTDNSIKNTVLAALEMQDFIEQRKKTNEKKDQPAFEMRVGIHTGPVVAGIVGVKKFQYDIWGDTVNTASRMESSGEVGKVNISQATYELLKDDQDFAFESRGKIEAKGKGEMEMWFVENKIL